MMMMKYKKPSQGKIHQDFLKGISHGTVLSIDPGQQNMGWAIIQVPEYNIENDNARIVIDYGTIRGKGRGSKLSASIIDPMIDIWKTYNINILAIEDYTIGYSQNKSNRMKGIFVIPGIIYTLKYLWYKKTGKDAMTIYSSTWKTSMGISLSASKQDVKDSLREFMPAKKIVEIEEDFERSNQKGHQDCLDAICIGMYVCKQIILNS
jgi:Holliday junction resolvasome RuvABC endonuclease subunit